VGGKSKPSLTRSNIEWCRNKDGTAGYAWSIVTGCKHGCPYCYARSMANRFDKHAIENGTLHVMAEAIKGTGDQFPHGFDPTYRPYTIDRLLRLQKHDVAVFVAPLGDLFGTWIPDDIIEEAFDTMRQKPDMRFYCLTKNYNRYRQLYAKGISFPENAWMGVTITNCSQYMKAAIGGFFSVPAAHRWVSCEPFVQNWIADATDENLRSVNWWVFGGMTGHYAVKTHFTGSYERMVAALPRIIDLKKDLVWFEKENIVRTPFGRSQLMQNTPAWEEGANHVGA